jgi:hypothetical protein
VDLRVFAVDGREVRGLVHDLLPVGAHAVAWDGRDARGRRVPAGVYFLRLEAPGTRFTRRIVRID